MEGLYINIYIYIWIILQRMIFVKEKETFFALVYLCKLSFICHYLCVISTDICMYVYIIVVYLCLCVCMYIITYYMHRYSQLERVVSTYLAARFGFGTGFINSKLEATTT